MSKSMRVGLLWQGDAVRDVTLESSGLASVARALRNVGIEVEAVVYRPELSGDVHDQLSRMDGVLVWVNPVEQGGDRRKLNALLREASSQGTLVSAHPDIIDLIGTKEVVFETRAIGWGSDIRRYATSGELRAGLTTCLARGPRVLKRSRGNGGLGVWKVELAAPNPVDSEVAGDTIVKVRHAERGSVEQEMRLHEFLVLMERYFEAGDVIVDQEYQSRLTDGMVRCYLVGDQLVGFGEQLVNALYPAPDGGKPGDAPHPGIREYFPASREDFQPLKDQLERDWLPAMCATLSIDRTDLPVIWDADFLHGPPTATGEPTYVLCEINVSSVFPFPDDALGPLADEMLLRLSRPVVGGNS